MKIEKLERILLWRDNSGIDTDTAFIHKVCAFYEKIYPLILQVEKEAKIDLHTFGDTEVNNIFIMGFKNQEEAISAYIKSKMVDNSIGSFGGLPISKKKLIDLIELPESVKALEKELSELTHWKNQFERYKNYNRFVDHIVFKNEQFLPTAEILETIIEEHSIYTDSEQENIRYYRLKEAMELLGKIANENNLPLSEYKISESTEGHRWEGSTKVVEGPYTYSFDPLVVRNKR